MMRAAVGVISKLPRAGETKTRLVRTLGESAALALHRAFLADELEQLHSPEHWQLYLVHDEVRTDAEAHALEALLAGQAQSMKPAAVDLAHELREAFETLLAVHERVVIVSGDVPQICKNTVADALDALDDADVVLGPGPDGGYYLVGLKMPHDLFTPITMSTGAVAMSTALLARRMGLRVAFVESLTDIDEAQDLFVIERAPGWLASRTRAVLATLDRSEIAPSLPTELQIEVTSRCNLGCTACLRTHVQLAPEADLTFDDFRDIVDPLPRLGRVAFQLNGEPLMARDVFDMIRHAVALGASTVLNTNGTLLDARRREAILDSGLDELRVSLNGADRESVAQRAGADVLGSITDGIDGLVRSRDGQHRPRISLWMIGTRTSIGELPRLVRLAAKLGVDEVYLQRLVITGHGDARRENSLHGHIAEAEDAIACAQQLAEETGVALRASGRRPLRESFTPQAEPDCWAGCWRPWRSAVVTASRWVLPCCIASFTTPYEELKLGDLNVASWVEIWNDEPYRVLRRGLLTGEPLDCCRGCALEWSL